MFKFVLITFLALQGSLCLAQTSDFNDARVTLPYKELKSLLDAAHSDKIAEKSKPPVPSTLLSARYTMALQSGLAEGTVEIETQSFSDEWTIIPLIDSEAQIDRIDPADAQIIVQEGCYALVSNHLGKTKITIHFASLVSTKDGGQSFEVPFARAPIKTLALTGVPEGQIVQVAGGTLMAEQKGSANYRLPKEQTVEVKIVAPPKPPEPRVMSHWKIETQALVRYGEGKLRYQAHISAFAQDGSGLDIDLVAPAAARILEIKGDDLLCWNAGKTLLISWKTRNLLSREFDLIYEIPQPATSDEWKLQAPRLAGGETSNALFAVVGEQGMEMRAAGGAPARSPRWLAQCASQQSVVLVGPDGDLAVKWLPLIQTTPAIIDSAQSLMRVVLDGSLLNEITYSIRHDGPLNWQLHLPAGSELLTCAVDGCAVNPVDRGHGVIELAFNAGSGKSPTEVKISSIARKDAFKPVSGQIQLELPVTDLLIQRLDWELRIPASYALAAIEGNVEMVPSGTSGRILLRKELCKNEQPVVRLFYQKPETKK